MSGGSHDYIAFSLANALNIPSGRYGGIGEDKDDYRAVRKANPMEDIELSEMMYDITCLLHSLEWYHSCDTDEDTYRKDVKAFKDKWFSDRNARLKPMIEEMIEGTKQELLEVVLFND